jgi:imidazolonepropionase-like amidohydrolase
MLILRNGRVINGDGRTAPFDGSVLVDGQWITAVGPDDYTGGTDDVVYDLDRALVMPGAIDAHAHALAPGPRFASATPGVSVAEALGNLRRHLTQGHTTLVDLDGFKLPGDTAEVRDRQPVRVENATIHFDPMFAAADAADGSGLTPAHRAMTAAEMVRGGAVVLGEVGAGMTLGGGGQDYMYIPAAMEKATGVRLTPAKSTKLKYAVLGRHIRPGNPDRDRIRALLASYGLAEAITVEATIELIEQSVLPSFSIALDGLVKSASLAVELGVPTLVHNSAPSDGAAREAAEIAGALFIGGHTNHGTFSSEEAVANARWIRQHGGVVEVDTFDAWGRRELHAGPEHLIALAQEGLIDIIATDYAAGHWDGMFEMVDALVRVGLVPLEKAVAMATGNVGRAIPRIGTDRGLLKAGHRADIVIATRRSPADIRLVVIDGRVVLARGPVPTVPVPSA